MPYISEKDRLKAATFDNVDTPGKLNYKLAVVIDEYFERKKVSYGTFNDVVGALECLKAEIERRFLFPYEDMKRIENGEVFLSLRDQMYDELK